jgi:rhodanese-related sulfurtransferase
MENKKIVSICIIGLMLVSTGISVSATEFENKSLIKKVVSQPLTNEIVNITVNETWDMLNNAGDGIQFYVDVRTNGEWNDERIDTPIPEHPRHFNLHLLQDATFLEKFMSLYSDVETLIIGCKSGGRSWKAAKIIRDAGFEGNLHNMIGGLLGWKAAGRPTVLQGGIYNITVDDVWELCTDTANGLQIPIDVRYDYEWYAGYIDTPYPESAVWYNKSILETPDGLETFLRTYEGNEVVLYCKGGYRSLLSAYRIMGADFNGTIYNMLGGIGAWQTGGYPFRNNTAPDVPNIDGPAREAAGVNITFEFSTTDAEDDGVKFMIDWGDGSTEETDMIAVTDTASAIHLWAEKGTYTITATAIDFYGFESNTTTFEIKIPRSRATYSNILEMLFEKYPNALPIFRYIFGL